MMEKITTKNSFWKNPKFSQPGNGRKVLLRSQLKLVEELYLEAKWSQFFLMDGKNNDMRVISQ